MIEGHFDPREYGRKSQQKFKVRACLDIADPAAIGRPSRTIQDINLGALKYESPKDSGAMLFMLYSGRLRRVTSVAITGLNNFCP
jgi:hypothetical protein